MVGLNCTGQNDHCMASEQIKQYPPLGIASHLCQGGLGDTCVCTTHGESYVLAAISKGSYHFPICSSCVVRLGLKW